MTHAGPQTPEEMAALIAAGTPQHDENGKVIENISTCGTCGRRWNDAMITGWTPAPSGRCPFEYWHGEKQTAKPAPSAQDNPTLKDAINWLRRSGEYPVTLEYVEHALLLMTREQKIEALKTEALAIVKATGSAAHDQRLAAIISELDSIWDNDRAAMAFYTQLERIQEN